MTFKTNLAKNKLINLPNDIKIILPTNGNKLIKNVIANAHWYPNNIKVPVLSLALSNYPPTSIEIIWFM